jgi:hypothetical protein
MIRPPASLGPMTDAEANLWEHGYACGFADANAVLTAAEEALALLKKGAPGWGVAKDLLNEAIRGAYRKET